MPQANYNRIYTQNARFLRRPRLPLEFMQTYKLHHSVTDADSCQHLVHHGPTECATAFFQKLIDTGRAAGKLYILFHVIPFLMRLRKIRTAGELGKLVLRTLKEYGRSLLFMSMLVGLLRGMLCFNWNLPPKRIIRPCMHCFI